MSNVHLFVVIILTSCIILLLQACDDSSYGYPVPVDVGTIVLKEVGCPVPYNDDEEVPEPTPDPSPTPEIEVCSEEGKYVVCHFPRGDSDNYKTICVGEAAVDAHLEHGDAAAPCWEL